MKQIMEGWRKYLADAKYKNPKVSNKESYSDMIRFSGASELFIPLGASLMKRVFGDLPEDRVGFHITNMSGVYGLINLQGSTKQVSVMTRGMSGGTIAKGVTNKAGIVVELEGRIVAAAARDIFTIPSKGGRRNIPMKTIREIIPEEIADSIEEEILRAIRKAQDVIEPVWIEDEDLYDPGELDQKEKEWRAYMKDPIWWWYNVSRTVQGKTQSEMIKYYLDSVEAIMVKYADDLRKAILSPEKEDNERYRQRGVWDENVMDRLKVKAVYIHKDLYKKRGMAGYPTDEEFKKFISDMDSEGIDLYAAEPQEILDRVTAVGE